VNPLGRLAPRPGAARRGIGLPDPRALIVPEIFPIPSHLTPPVIQRMIQRMLAVRHGLFPYRGWTSIVFHRIPLRADPY